MSDLLTLTSRASAAAMGCGTSRAISPGRGTSPVVELVLATDEQFMVTGTTYQDHIVGPVVQGIGPHLEDIVVHARGRSFSSNFRYKVRMQWSYDADDWQPGTPVDLLGEQSITTPVISTPYTTRTNFGIYIRFLISVVSGDTGTANGNLSVTVALRLFS